MLAGLASCAKHSAPPADTRVHDYELQEKCGKDARAWFERAYPQPYTKEVNGRNTVITSVNYENHYNQKLNKCFAVVSNESSESIPDKPSDHSIIKTLMDVNENREVGSVYDRYTNAPLRICSVADAECTSLKKWDALASTFMTQ